MKILVETSARHVHVTEEDLETLFGKGAELTVRANLSQPGQFASEQRVEIVGPKGSMKNVIIIGPTRPQTQGEISLTDARSIGVVPPIRESGDLKDSAPFKLVGPEGEVELTEGLIAAKRHVHATPEDAEKMGVKDKEIVMVKIDTPERSAILGDVIVRVNKNYATAMHIDTDESNAIAASGEVYGEIVK